MKSSVSMPLRKMPDERASEHWATSAIGEKVILLCMVALAFGLRLFQLGTESVWLDEQFSIRDAEQLRLGTRPLYYLLLHGWMWINSSDAWLRSLSLLFSTATIVLVYWLGRKLVSREAGWIAAFMAAVSPLFVGYGQEIRMYALSTFLTLAGTLVFVHMVEKPRPLAIGGWVGLRVLAILTTPLNVLLLLVDAIMFAWQARRHPRLLLLMGGAMAVIAVATLPVAIALSSRFEAFFGDWISSKPLPNIMRLTGVLTEFTVFWPLTDLPTRAELQLSPAAMGWNEFMFAFYGGITLLVCAVFAVGLLVAVQRMRATPSDPGLLAVALWGTVPALVILIVSYAFGTLWFARYLLFVAPYALLVIAAGFLSILRWWRPAALALAAVYAVGLGGGLWHYYTTLYHDDWKGIARLINEREQSGDVIGLYPLYWEPQHSLPRYYEGPTPIVTWDGYVAKSDEAELRPLVIGMLDNLPATADRHWLVVYYHWDIFHETLREEIDRRYDVLLFERFPNSVNDDIRVYLLEPHDR